MSWMQRLKRVFAIDIETCPDCGGTQRVIVCNEDPPQIAKILTLLTECRQNRNQGEYRTFKRYIAGIPHVLNAALRQHFGQFTAKRCAN
jgi:hypothetical protein